MGKGSGNGTTRGDRRRNARRERLRGLLPRDYATDDLTRQPEAFNPVLKEVDFTAPALAA